MVPNFAYDINGNQVQAIEGSIDVTSSISVTETIKTQ